MLSNETINKITEIVPEGQTETEKFGDLIGYIKRGEHHIELRVWQNTSTFNRFPNVEYKVFHAPNFEGDLAWQDYGIRPRGKERDAVNQLLAHFGIL